MNLEAMVYYLADNGFGTPGIDLFHDNLPHDVESALVLLNITPLPIHPYLSTISGEFQIVGRDSDRQRLVDKMKSVSDAFSGGSELVIGDMLFKYIRPLHAPLVFPKTESDTQEASVSFAFLFVQQTT